MILPFLRHKCSLEIKGVGHRKIAGRRAWDRLKAHLIRGWITPAPAEIVPTSGV